MALIIADRVKETTITEGTGAITLSGATFGGFQSFSDAIGEGNTTYYCIQNEANFEIGIGTYSSNTLSRDTIFQSSNSDNKISISGTAIVFCVVPADRLIFKDESDAVIFPTPFAFKRSDDGDYWQALSTDHTNRVVSFFIEEGTDPVWKLGLKTTQSEIVAPYYALVTGKEGFVELRGSSSSILSIGDGNSEGLQISHQLKNIIDIRKNGGEIAIQNLDLSSDETTTAKNTSVAHTVFAIESSVSHAADLQTWSVATDEKASINQHGDFETSGNVISPSGRFNAIRFSDGSVQTSAGGGGGLPFSSGDYYLQEIRANSASGVVTSGIAAQNKTDIAIVSGLLYNDSSLSGYFESRVDSADSSVTANSGYFESRADTNTADIVVVSGLLYNDASLSGYFESRVDSSDSNISSNSSSITANSGYFESRVDSADSSVTASSGYFESRIDAADSSISTNSSSITANSGYFESRVDSADSSIAANSGYFESRVDSADSSIAANSGYFESRVDSADSSITANSGYFESRVDVNAADIVTISGITVKEADGSPNVSNVRTIVVSNGTLTDNSNGQVTITTGGGGGSSYDDAPISGYFESRVDAADTNISTNSSSITANSGYFESRVDSADSSITANSGYFESRVDAADTNISTNSSSITANSGYFESRVDSADSSITANSGYFESRVDSADSSIAANSGYFESRVDSADSSIAANSGYFESRVDSADSSISTNSSSITANSGYFESRVDSADSSITANSGYFESRVDSADSSITANSGYFESRVDTNADDIVVVSGLTGGGGDVSGDTFATDLKIGRDSQNLVDFATTDNKIILRANNVNQVSLVDNVFGPEADSDVDLGTTSVRWKDAYIDSITTTGKITAGGSINQAPNTATDGGIVDIDCSAANYHEILMNADATRINFTNVTAGQRVIVRFKQHSSHIDLNSSEGFNDVDVNGGNATIKWAGGIVPTLTESNNAVDVYGFIFESTVTNVMAFIIGQDIK